MSDKSGQTHECSVNIFIAGGTSCCVKAGLQFCVLLVHHLYVAMHSSLALASSFFPPQPQRRSSLLPLTNLHKVRSVIDHNKLMFCFKSLN